MKLIISKSLCFFASLQVLPLSYAFLFVLLITPAQASNTTTVDSDDMLSLDFEQLLDIEVLSSAKKLQSLSKSASAIFVITDNDIQRSGKTSIPELLRMVPGIEVASFNAHAWAVSIRGFNLVFTNKLLVLLDGRSVYSWDFNGTFWYTIDTLLEDIERIEVIRGPGGTLWGANAVNGVINIITKESRNTQGWLAATGAGSYEEGFAHLRYGGKFDEYGQNTYRVYVKRHDRDSFPNAVYDNSWRQESVGMRMDGTLQSHYRWRLSTDFTHDALQDSIWNIRQAISAETENFNILGNIGSLEDVTQPWHLQVHFQTSKLDIPLPGNANSLDIEWQHRFSPYQNHDLIWGLNARRMYSELENLNGFYFAQSKRLSYLYSGFAQDEIVLSPDRWVLTLGAKLEHYKNSDTALLPNLRLLWTPDEINSVWLAVSRAVRPATRLEQEMRYEIVAPQQVLTFAPNADIASEYLTAYELGWRQKTTEHFKWEAVGFVHDYMDLMTRITEAYQKEGVLYIDRVPINQINDQIYGTELSFTWQPHTDYSIQFAYTWLDVNVGQTSPFDPQHQVSLRSGWQATPDFRTDLWFRYVDKICGFSTPMLLPVGECIKAYNTIDLRFAWQLNKQLELSFNGFNLLDSQHLEFESDGSDFLSAEVPRQFYLQVLWKSE